MQNLIRKPPQRGNVTSVIARLTKRRLTPLFYLAGEYKLDELFELDKGATAMDTDIGRGGA